MNLLHLFSGVKDGRGRKGRYTLSSLLMLVVAGKMRGCATITAYSRFGKRLTRKQRERLGLRRGAAPSISTMTVALGAMDAQSQEDALTGRNREAAREGTVVAVDGKRLWGSADGDAKAAHLLAAFAVELLKTLAQHPVREGTNEITALLDWLETLDVSGLIVTGDAIFAQREICRKITDKGGDFVFTVKDNQPELRRRIEAATQAAEASFSPSRGARRQRRNSA